MPTVPLVGESKPAMMLNSVLLPQPDDPMMETNSPGFTVKEMSSSTARWRPSASEKVREMPSSCKRGTDVTLIGSGPFSARPRNNGEFQQARESVEHNADRSHNGHHGSPQAAATSILSHAHITAQAMTPTDP